MWMAAAILSAPTRKLLLLFISATARKLKYPAFGLGCALKCLLDPYIQCYTLLSPGYSIIFLSLLGECHYLSEEMQGAIRKVFCGYDHVWW